MSFTMKHRLSTLCLLVFLLFTIDNASTAGLQAGLTPIYSGRDLTNFYWSPDSSGLVFQKAGFESGVELEEADYFYFDVLSQTLEQTTIWPLQPALSAQEQQTYSAKNAYRFLSPNQRFMVYVADAEDPVLAIADRQTVAAKLFDVLIGKTLETNYFFTLWSANSERVVVGNYPILGHFPRYFYISNFTSNVQNATIQELPVTVVFSEKDYTTGRIRDINADGSLLLTGSTDLASAVGSQLDTRLALFRLSDMSIQTIFVNARVREQNIMAAAFDPYDERYLLALTQEGIQRYDTLENTWTMVNADINATWVDYAQFSPDGRYIVVQDKSASNTNLSDVYVIDLAQEY